MTTKSAPKKKSTALDAVPKLVALLTPLSAEDQKRAVSAAMILLGAGSSSASASVVSDSPSDPLDLQKGVSPKAAPWLKKNSIAGDDLEQVFLIDDEVIEVIAGAMPGKGKRQQTIQAYLLCGLQSFLGSGDAAFSDKQARALCTKVGCYDPPNHTKYMKDFRNWISGSQDSGWRLTNPGLSEAAQIVKQLIQPPVN